jgi:hypothetical protein
LPAKHPLFSFVIRTPPLPGHQHFPVQSLVFHVQSLS